MTTEPALPRPLTGREWLIMLAATVIGGSVGALTTYGIARAFIWR